MQKKDDNQEKNDDFLQKPKNHGLIATSGWISRKPVKEWMCIVRVNDEKSVDTRRVKCPEIWKFKKKVDYFC